jgi:cell division septum initiation protein DivIVA
MTEPDQHPEPGPDAGIDEIQEDIERTRDQLGETVGALSSKLDVKQRAKQKATDTKELITDKAHAIEGKASELSAGVVSVATDERGSVKPIVPFTVVATVAVILGIVIWKRRH